jgi:hypothetical protein
MLYVAWPALAGPPNFSEHLRYRLPLPAALALAAVGRDKHSIHCQCTTDVTVTVTQAARKALIGDYDSESVGITGVGRLGVGAVRVSGPTRTA